jgi:hypothetical protein
MGYTPTLTQYWFDERAGGKRLGHQFSVCKGNCCALIAFLINVGSNRRALLPPQSTNGSGELISKLLQAQTCVWPSKLRHNQTASSTLNLRLCLANNCVQMPGFVAQKAQTCCVHQTKSRLIGSCAMRVPTLEPASSKSNSKPNGCHTTRRRHGRQATINQRSKPTAVTAKMGNRRQASNLKRKKASSSHCQHGHKTLASYGALLFNSKKGASQQQSWPTWVLDFGKLQDPIF